MARKTLDVLIAFLSAGLVFALFWRLSGRHLVPPLNFVALMGSLIAAAVVFKKLQQTRGNRD